MSFRLRGLAFRRLGLAFRLNRIGFRRFGFAFQTDTFAFRRNMFGFRRFAVSGILPTLAMRRGDVIPCRQEWRFCHRVVERESCWAQDMPKRLLAGNIYVIQMMKIVALPECR